MPKAGCVTNGQTWIICGGRDFTDVPMFVSAMSGIINVKGCPSRIVHGAATGTDSLAAGWGCLMAIDVVAVAAQWDKYGKSAGPIRNREMLDRFAPSLVVAFPGGKGTASMVKRARLRLIDVIEIKENEPNANK